MEQSLENKSFWDFSALQLTATQSSLKQKCVIMKCLFF
jgi:hypothetical protein